MSARVFYADGDEASAAAEVLKAFGQRAVTIARTVAEVAHGTERVEWEVIALDLPAQQHYPAPAVGPIVDDHEDDHVSSYWWDEDGHGRSWDRD